MPQIELIRPLELSPTGGSELTIENRGSATVYYGRSSTVGPTNNIGTLKENEKLVLTKGFVWVVAESTNEELGSSRKQLPVILDLREKEIEPAGGGGITVKEVEKIVKELAIGGGVKLGKPFEPEGTFKAKHAYEPSSEHDAIVYLSLEQEDEWKVSVDGVEVQHEKSELNSANVVPVITVLVPAGSSWSVDSTVGEGTIPRVVYQFIELTTGTLVPIGQYITGPEKAPNESFTPSTLNATIVTVVLEFFDLTSSFEMSVNVNGESAATFEPASNIPPNGMAVTVLCAPGDVISLTMAEEESEVQKYTCYYRELASATLPSQSVSLIGPIPVAFNSPGIQTTGFPVLNLSAGQMVTSFGVTADVRWNAELSLRIPDSSGVVCINGGTVEPQSTPENADALTISSVTDGWTMAKGATPVVLFDSRGEVLTEGSGKLYIMVWDSKL